MNKTSLSLAIFMALGVVACGGSGSGSDNQAVPENPPVPTPEATPNQDNAAAHDSTLVDPTQTHVVDDRDLLKETTVGSLQYIRRDGSDYDRIYNPEQRASSTPLLGVPLDVQNPKLTNIVLARQELTREDGKPVKAQFAGGLSPEPLTREGRPQEHESLQIENFQNVDILAGAFKQFGSAKTHTDGSTQIPNTSSSNLGDKFDYDTHVADNVQKNGEFNRERVSHVYTLRYEYKQPYVDYPYINDPTHANHRTAAGGNPMLGTGSADYRTPPTPGYSPTAHDLLTAGGYNKGNYPNNYFNWDNARQSSWDPNNGLGVGGNAPVSGGTIVNRTNLFGSLDNVEWVSNTAPNAYSAKSWKNKNTDMERLAVGKTWVPGTAATPGHYTRGDRNGDNYTDQATLDWTKPSIHGRYPNGGYPWWVAGTPRYPNQPYNAASGTFGPGSGPFATNGAYNHEHTYLEEDEFTAIREGKPLRPLRNPKANTWSWPHYTSQWSTTYNYSGSYTVTTTSGNPPVSNTVTYNVSGVTAPFADTVEDINVSDIVGREGTPYTGFVCPSNADPGSCDVKITTIAKANIISGNWHGDPSITEPGVQGEFRGPAYDGYAESERVIRFADPRIWDSSPAGVAAGYKPEYERKYGANLIWWSTQDSAFENWATRFGWDPRARRVDNNITNDPEDLVRSKNDARDQALEIQPTGDITNGLIRIGGGRATLGEELKWDKNAKIWRDHHNTTTRVFGHYHLAWSDAGNIKPVTMNSYQGARSFVAATRLTVPGAPVLSETTERDAFRAQAKADLDSDPLAYSIGAIPMTLKKVQYGRVTTNLDIDVGEGPYDGGFLMAPFRYKNDGAAVDNYFYRGIEATTIDQMNAVTANNGAARYEGHALMYGIDNDYKGITKVGDVSQKSNLPNAFSIDTPPMGPAQDNARLGLGNFVQAEVDFGTKKVTGDVYNAWLEKQWVDSQKADGKVTKDLLVHFKGDIMGNTVIGTADRTYIAGDDQADFRASFFGEHADEMGGAFNSVKREQKYGSAYEEGDWGGVFGAKKVGSGNTFQGDDGATVYNGL